MPSQTRSSSGASRPASSSRVRSAFDGEGAGIVHQVAFAEDAGRIAGAVPFALDSAAQVVELPREQVDLLQEPVAHGEGLAGAREPGRRECRFDVREPAALDGASRARRRVASPDGFDPGGIAAQVARAASAFPSASSQAPRQYRASSPPNPSAASRPSRDRAASIRPAWTSLSTRPSSPRSHWSPAAQSATAATPARMSHHASRTRMRVLAVAGWSD